MSLESNDSISLAIWGGCAKVEIMQSVEKEGMKLYSKLEAIPGDRSVKLQSDMEDCENIGAYILDQSVRYPRVFKIGHILYMIYFR